MTWIRREWPDYASVRVETLTADGPGRYRLDRYEREVDSGSGEVTETRAQTTWEVDSDGWLLPARRERLVLGDGTFTLEAAALRDEERREAWAALAQERAGTNNDWK